MAAGKALFLMAVAHGGVEAARMAPIKGLSNTAVAEEPTAALMESPRSCEVPAQSQPGEPGQVDFVYSFGAPATGSPALRNPRRADGCFPGLRTWMTNGRGYWGRQRWTDGVAGILNTRHYWHALSDVEDIMEDKLHEDGFQACSSSQVGVPNSPWLSARLHVGAVYVQFAQGKLCDRWANATFFGRTENMKNKSQLVVAAAQMGWRMVGQSFYDVLDGAHLFQDPATHECLLTFMGTDGSAEWVSNGNIQASNFCGYTYESEMCRGRGACISRKPGGSFTHRGFTERLRSLVRSSEWRDTIQPNLGGCSKVYAVGHSAGGAMASLFQACVARAPQPGEFGYDSDYQYMQWTRGESRQLPYVPLDL